MSRSVTDESKQYKHEEMSTADFSLWQTRVLLRELEITQGLHLERLCMATSGDLCMTAVVGIPLVVEGTTRSLVSADARL